MATSEKKRVSPAGKIGIWHCAAILFAQVPKKCTDLDLSLLCILVVGTEYTADSIQKIIFNRSVRRLLPADMFVCLFAEPPHR